MKNIIIKLIPVIDLLLVPFVYPCAWLLKKIRWAGVHRLPKCKKALINMGVFPIRDHYFEPQFFGQSSRMPLSQDRFLPGINWNTAEQLDILSKLTFSQELSHIKHNKTSEIDFYINNGSFGPGDAEYWYQIIRLVKPQRIFEVGSGNSTLMAIKAVNKNHKEDPNYECKHLCIEPYESPWLEKVGVTVVRKKVEDLEVDFFSELGENDILFIDSSHVIRPQGDVLFECLELLPTLNNGVIVHFHDVFSPKNYPQHWVEDEVRLWNEQYLLEAFLTHNHNWKIVAAINFLKNHHYEKLKPAAPFLTPEDGPGSFYIKKVT
ncbi:MAG: class I SAM-dependent methyltransferase [Bacteroidales bacterium]